MAFENQELLGGDDVYCAAIGEDFSVDDLLNFEIEEDEQLTKEKEEEEEEEKLLEEQEERNSNSSSALSFEPPPVSELALPADDVAELEWVSRIMDESEFPTYAPHPKTGTQNHTHTHATQPPLPVKAKRSKRTRSPSGTWAPLHLTDSSTASMTSSATSPTSSCSSSPSYYSHLIFAHPVVFDEIPLTPPFKKQKPHKKRGRKPKQQQLLHGHHQIGMSSNKEERRCSHCGVNKTPQWRTGPEGAKTLCNACGVRYKSGRLLPEYRPACSPTFVSHVHSNSHRKVMEMRRKKEEEDKLVFIPVVTSF